MAKDPQLSPAATLELQTWMSQVKAICELAAQPDRAPEFIRTGTSLEQVRAMLLEAQATGLRSHEPIAALQLADDDGEPRTEQLPAAPPATADTVVALRYATMVGELCALAGMRDKAMAYIAAAAPIRLIRRELIEAQAAISAANPISNLHNCEPIPDRTHAPLDAAAIYERRRLAVARAAAAPFGSSRA